MGLDAVFGQQAEIASALGRLVLKLDAGRNKHGQLELHIDRKSGLGELVLQFGQAAGLGPHAVGNLPLEILLVTFETFSLIFFTSTK